MKKIIKNIFGLLFVLFLSSSLTGCIVLLDDDFSTYEYSHYGEVVFENRDSNRTTYIKEIKYCEEDSIYWHSCWTCPADNNDSDISFYLEPGNYSFQIEVIYPKYKYNKDYYDTFTTDSWSDISVSSGYTNTIVFDGEKLYER
ncbi:MAG: hypothetical protein K5829_10580 [Treponema sp.]|nr:hypothetical protein [Treponema sp.]